MSIKFSLKVKSTYKKHKSKTIQTPSGIVPMDRLAQRLAVMLAQN
jgi:hypothetical protein